MHFQYLSFSISFFFSQSFSISLICPQDVRTTNIGNATHPQLFYQLVASKNDDITLDYGIIRVWLSSRENPSFIRPVNSTSVATLFSIAMYALSSLPGNDLSKPYETIGPEYNERLSTLGTRLILKQYERPSATNGTDYPPKAEPMRNYELLVAASLLQTFYVPSGSLPPEGTMESAWWGCHLRGKTWATVSCTATIMVQVDLWS